MTLAFQCGKWDLDAFEEEIPARIMNRWVTWFARRPQGQHHQDKIATVIGASLLNSKGCKITRDDLMVDYPATATEDENLSIEDQCKNALQDVPKKKRKLKAPDAERSGNATDCGFNPVHAGDAAGTD